jgi:hypothetical protein
MSARCRECGTPIEWVETTTGRRMPLDVIVDPERKGNVGLVPRPGGEPVARVVAQLQHGLGVPHFATCPVGRRKRGRKGGAAA